MQLGVADAVEVMATVAVAKVTQVQGMARRSPPSFLMSVSSPLPCITDPAPRKRQALKNACVTRCRMAAQNTPIPTPMNMNPSWETVE